MVTSWQNCLFTIRDEVTPEAFTSLFGTLQVVAISTDGNKLRLLAPNKYVCEEIKEQYLDRIKEIMSGAQKGECAVEVSVGIGNVAGLLSSSSSSVADEEVTAVQGGIQTGLPANVPHNPEQMINAEGSSIVGKDESNPFIPLREAFTFDTFVEGKSNQIALAASLRVATREADTQYNPLLLYGDVGLGKTHLMHAIGNSIVQSHPTLKVVCMSANQFVKSMVQAITKNRMKDFTEFYQSVDVLLVDDIQFLIAGPKTQEEFFHLFNRLQEKCRKIVMTSDRHPSEIERLDDRLTSRFGGGMTACMEMPELETRVAILLKKAERMPVDLSQEAAFFIAERVRSNVRELEGALHRVSAGRQTGEHLTLEEVKESLSDLVARRDRQLSIDNIQRVVAEYYNIHVSDLLSQRRTRSITRPRQLTMALARDLTSHSLPEIGAAFNRDHSTVVHAHRKVEEWKESNKEIADDYDKLLRMLTA